MKKIAYEKPSMRIVELQHKCQLLAGSYTDPEPTPPNEIPDYDDWLGARQNKDMWEDDEEDLGEEEL